eukprot:CAMPEP_0197001796 /NCGR_PEP_ID=MMETSP1380-20130617/6420_1 /TAXON_ID=5936 /ORGANISM="Euplotes crassus, Strain CT5" /LENGTH=152 /DNA_ID=CAMNT_0042419617 /DNA_START=18 /DNA_END=476 /DNA_ORIENTATION=+
MDSDKNLLFDENLPEDFLSENVTPGKVNTIAHLTKNMDHTPFKSISGGIKRHTAHAYFGEKRLKNFHASQYDSRKETELIFSTKVCPKIEEVDLPSKPMKLSDNPHPKSNLSQDITTLLKRVRKINARSKNPEIDNPSGFKLTMRNVKPSLD